MIKTIKSFRFCILIFNLLLVLDQTVISFAPLFDPSVQFSCSVVSDSLRSHELQHARLPCPSPTPRACSLMFIESVMPSNHLILCYPPLLLPSIFPRIRVFSDKMESCHYKPMPARLRKKKKNQPTWSRSSVYLQKCYSLSYFIN